MTFCVQNIDIRPIDNAIEIVSNERSKLGAYENILGTTTNYLNNSMENMQSSKSRIADVDYATEILKYSKNNILIQANHALIAQNKQNTNNVISLLN